MPDLLQSKKVKTRKAHTCQGCGRRIEKGETVQADTLADGGEIYRLYHCDECQGYLQKHCNHCPDHSETCIGVHYPIGQIRECRKEREADAKG